MPVTVLVTVLPATSAQLAVADRLSPSPDTTVSAGWPAAPDRASVQVQATATSPVCQPLEKPPVRTGSVVSTSTPLTPALVLLPAPSVTVALALWFGPSCRTSEAGLLAMPEPPESLAEYVTVTSVLYQPAAFLVPPAVAVSVGAVLSIRTLALSVALLPAPSVAVPVTVYSPSADLVTGAVQPATPDPPWSAQSNVTVTSWLVQAPFLYDS